MAVPYRYVLGSFIASTAVNSLASPLEVTDLGDTGVLRRARWLHLVGLSTIGLLLTTVSSAASVGAGTVGMIRAYLAWSGLALHAVGLLLRRVRWRGAPLRAGLLPGWMVLRRRTLGRCKRPRGRHGP